jgi:hypothetical protein
LQENKFKTRSIRSRRGVICIKFLKISSSKAIRAFPGIAQYLL